VRLIPLEPDYRVFAWMFGIASWIDLIPVAGTIALSTLAAALVPSVRAALVDPAETLRGE
jgi:hypothetical protein